MNGKQAKALRRAAGYRNQTATPGVMDFPGVARLVKHPKYKTHTTAKTCYVTLPGDARPTKITTDVQRLTLDRHRQPIPLVEENPGYGKPVAGTEGLIDNEQFRQTFDLVPNSKPGKIRPNSPKGVYRALKKSARHGLLGAAAKAEDLIDELADSVRVVA